MRMGFFMGAVIGAAATYYMSRNNTNMKQMPNKAMNAFMGMMSSDSSNQKQNNQNNQDNQNNQNNQSHQNEMEQMVQQDPELKKEIDQIMQENESPSFTQ